MDLIVEPSGFLRIASERYRCALGRGGVTRDKREGDGATPAGTFVLRRLFYRPDRLAAPASGLATTALRPTDGWCDDPASPHYNLFVTLPFEARHEKLWRDDALYDVIGVIGYNDAPVVSGLGSAIFLHIAAPGYTPTEGCVALAVNDLLRIVALCDPATRIEIQAV